MENPRIPIEEVINSARFEAQRRFAQETESERTRQQEPDSRDTLQTAVDNLQVFDSWVEKGTWLREYLTRRSQAIVIYEPWYGQLSRIPVVEDLVPEVILKSLYLTLDGVHKYESVYEDGIAGMARRFKVDPEGLERCWTSGNRQWSETVERLAKLSRPQVALRVLQAIK